MDGIYTVKFNVLEQGALWFIIHGSGEEYVDLGDAYIHKVANIIKLDPDSKVRGAKMRDTYAYRSDLKMILSNGESVSSYLLATS